MSGPLILAIESSCDETGIALVEGGRRIHANVVASQVAQHAATGGIVPEVAARAHLRWIVPALDAAWADAGVGWADVDAVAVTYGPGLTGSLLVGINFAKALSHVRHKPLVGVNHLEGHVYAGWLLDPGEAERPAPAFPIVALVVSGGHTFLVEMRDSLTYRLLGQTLDDAAGEAFDKTAKMLGLPYPGGAALAALAASGIRGRFVFPRPMLDRPGLDFSFSGLKTAALVALRGRALDDAMRADVARGFEDAVVDTLAEKCRRALESSGHRRLIVAGGVGANHRLRERLDEVAQAAGARLYFPRAEFCTDNGAMIALAGCLRLSAGMHRGGAAAAVRAKWELEGGETAEG